MILATRGPLEGSLLEIADFGSDGPWLHPGVELAKTRLLNPAAGASVRRIFRLQPR